MQSNWSGELPVGIPKASTAFVVNPLSALPVCASIFAKSKFPSVPGAVKKELFSIPKLLTIPKLVVVIFFITPPSSTRTKSASLLLVVVAAPSLFAVVITVPVTAGSVIVTSAVLAGPISVTLFVPLSLSSKNSTKPALVAAFLSCIPAFAIGVVSTGVVSVLLVRISDPVKEAKLSLCNAELNSANEPVRVLVPKSIDLFVNVSVVALPTSVSAAAGKVTVTSAVEAGPINLTLFVPLSLSS